jgi:predicted MFS family arabinose efflux permease
MMEAVSGLCAGVFWVGLVALLVDRGAGAEGFALAAIARLGPRALISAPASVLASRVDCRRLLVGLDLVRAALMLCLAVAAAMDASSGLLLVIVFATYTVAAPYRPELTAALPVVTGEGGLSSGNALIATVRQVMTFVGPVVGTILLHYSSSSVAFAVDAASFVVSAAVLATISQLAKRPRIHDNVRLSSHRRAWLHEIGEGWREVNATAGLAVITVLVFVMYAARGAEMVLLVLVAEQRVGLGAAGIGVLSGAIGLGAVCVLPVASRIAETPRPATVITVSLATTAVPLAALGFVRSPFAACSILCVMGAGIVVFEVVSVMLLQRLTRRDVLGRVFGLVGTCSSAGKLIGALAAPGLVALAGLRGALLLSAGTVAIVAAAALPRLIVLSRVTRARGRVLRPTVEVLEALGIFEGAPWPALERVAAAVMPERLDAGTVVIRAGDPADDLFVVREGVFSVTDAQRRVINTMVPGDWFGEIGLLQSRPRTATVTATTEAFVWRISGVVFLEALQENAGTPSALIEVMTDRLALLGASADAGAAHVDLAS